MAPGRRAGVYGGLRGTRVVPVPFSTVEEPPETDDLALLRLARILAH